MCSVVVLSKLAVVVMMLACSQEVLSWGCDQDSSCHDWDESCFVLSSMFGLWIK